MSATLILLRHGESEWNLANRFTGWIDVDLSPKGIEEAKRGGQQIRRKAIEIDICFTSVLKRAIRTLWIALDEMDQMWVPVIRAWQLNERHYGGLQGLNKSETAKKFGEDQVKIWRRSFDIPPPPLDLRRSDPPALRAALCAHRSGGAAVDGIPQDHARPGDAVLGQHHRSAPEARRDGADRRPRQQPARAGQAPQQDLGRGHHRAQHPDRPAARLRTRRRPAGRSPTATSPTRTRCGRPQPPSPPRARLNGATLGEAGDRRPRPASSPPG